VVREFLVRQLVVGPLLERTVVVGPFLERAVVERHELVGRRMVVMVRRIVISLAEHWQHSVAIWVAARDRWDAGTWLARSWG
jgi:hypothetical protein